MRDVTKLVKRKIVRKDAKFFDDVTDILREEGYSNHWHDFREKMHVVFDENESLKSKVEEMQKTMQDIHDKLNNSASHEFEETIQYCITKAFYALKGVANE